MQLYLTTIAPHYVPSNGGFSVTQYTLQGLYQQFQKGLNWWTQSNEDFPFIRYLGCKFQLYKSDSADYVFSYHRCGPMLPNLQTYQSCQPSMLCLNKRRKIIRCKKNNPYKRPYKTLRIKPPTHLHNTWYFQKEMADTPLLLTMSSAVSLDRWYAASNSISTTIGFTGLNTDVFTFHNFMKETTSGYHPNNTTYFYSFQQSGTQLPEVNTIQIGNLIFLGATNSMQPGTTIKDVKIGNNSFSERFLTWKTNSGWWGNVFIPLYLRGPAPILSSPKSPSQLTNYNNDTDTLKAEHNFQYYKKPLLTNYRYNPYFDRGDENIVFLTSINDQTEGWTPSADPKLKTDNLPLWILMFGLIDFWKLQFKTIPIETERCIAFHTKYIEPKDQHIIVPLDEDFLTGTSPYRPKGETTPSDKLHWHPKTSFQQRTINTIATSGPGVVKLPPNVSVEGHCKYSFYFKLGSCSAPTKTIENPEMQPTNTKTNNFLQKPSLQSPELPLQNFLYNFDWRRGMLTETALKRMQKYTIAETTLSALAGQDPFNPPPNETASETDSSDTEKEKETLQLLLNKQRKKQQQFKQRILQLLTM